MVGVSNDAEILHHKGPTVMTEDERYKAVAGCKWVDEVVTDAPYTTDIEMLRKHDIDIVVHGEDQSVDVDGNDSYRFVKEAGMFRYVGGDIASKSFLFVCSSKIHIFHLVSISRSK